jgi:hypothetical protein
MTRRRMRCVVPVVEDENSRRGEWLERRFSAVKDVDGW